MRQFSLILIFLLSLGSVHAAEPLRIAVAANFFEPAQTLKPLFEAEHDISVDISVGSTGALYAQIVNGAPYDLFLSADQARPEALQSAGRSSHIEAYAYGQVILVTRADADKIYAGRIAIADPEVAPYGVAALQVLETDGHEAEGAAAPDLVYGSSLAQTAGFLVSGNVDTAFLAASQREALLKLGEFRIDNRGDSHEPIAQFAAVIGKHPGARAFLDFMRAGKGRDVLLQFGYGVP